MSSKSFLESILRSMDLRKKESNEETDLVPIDERKETIQFPWFIAIVIGVLKVLIIACIIVIKVLEG